jgi:hypothetical protein
VDRRVSPARIRRARRAPAAAGLAIGLLAAASISVPACLPSQQPEWQLDLCVVRIDPADEPFAIGDSALTDSEAEQLRKLFPTGVVRSGLSANVDRSNGRPFPRMLVVVTGPLPPRSALAKPRDGSVIYVQNGDAWRRYPEDAPLLPDSVEMSPLANGKIRLKYWERGPVEFGFFVPVKASADAGRKP